MQQPKTGTPGALFDLQRAHSKIKSVSVATSKSDDWATAHFFVAHTRAHFPAAYCIFRHIEVQLGASSAPSEIRFSVGAGCQASPGCSESEFWCQGHIFCLVSARTYVRSCSKTHQHSTHSYVIRTRRIGSVVCTYGRLDAYCCDLWCDTQVAHNG